MRPPASPSTWGVPAFVRLLTISLLTVRLLTISLLSTTRGRHETQFA